MSDKLKNAPVYYALAQAQFNPVAAIAKYAAEIQDELRLAGYPLQERQEGVQVQLLATDGINPPQPQISPVHMWTMVSGDRRSGFILAPNAITFHTTSYETREEFLPQLMLGLEVVHRIARLEFVARLGLRYLDAVTPAEHEAVSAYLVPGVHGVNFSARLSYQMSESIFDTDTGPLIDKGTLISRVHRLNGPIGLPPDLQLNGLVLLEKFATRPPAPHAVIDTDHFVQGQMKIDLDALAAQARRLHSTIKDAFGATVTLHAVKTWE